MSKIDITIFIPTYNGEKYIFDVLNAIVNQKITKKYEVLIIDSGSTDNTLSIINNFVSCDLDLILHCIPNSDYGHGKTRQLAAKMSRGDYVVYLSHDAIPAHDLWLYELIRPFEIHGSIAGVMGKQIPRSHCHPLLKYEIINVFKQFGPDFGTTLFYKDEFVSNQAIHNAVSFYSDVNSATKKDLLLNHISYRDVTYAEDQLFGKDLIDNGYYKVYAPRASVVHSNDVSLSQYNKRLFDETLALRQHGFIRDDFSIWQCLKLLFLGIAADAFMIVKDSEYTIQSKFYWFFVNPLYHLQKWRGVKAALSISLNDDETLKKLSLEQVSKDNSSRHV